VCVRSKGYDAVSDWVPAACMGNLDVYEFACV